ncbi:LacI family transcriptional regulator [Kitasatospora purpeofusca]|uniref:LacI family DNA-binding transcriptional regulator n=1 Tax=Kitasatospora purpeofusca TaxID=67352 RepID=UPI003248BC20
MNSSASARRPKRITIEDVAHATGVSRQTVSRAINDKGEIDPATRERILEAARTLGYRPNRFARAMVQQGRVTLGLLVPNIVNPFFPEVAHGVLEAAGGLGWNVVMHQTQATLEGELAAIDMAEQQTDAFVGYLTHAEAVYRARRAALPFTLLDGGNRELHGLGANRVDIDFRHGLEQGLAHLVQLGHHRIGMLDSGRDRTSGLPSLRGELFLECARALGLTIDADWQRGCANSVEGGRLAMDALLDEHPQITAVMAYNDTIAIGALRAALARDLRVPAHCAVVGFDGLGVSELVTPSLTTLQVDKERLGREAVRLAEAVLTEPGRPMEVVILRPKLIIRASTDPAH